MRASRRDLLRAASVTTGVLASHMLPIYRALAIPARRTEGTIRDVKHVVILMQENRSFDHYFGTLKGVRGFGDRHTVPLSAERPVWKQSNGERILPPFWLDTQTTNAMKVPETPHSFSDAQAAWKQGILDEWPRFKTDYAMGYYKREDIPFQFALAEAFTICDAYHCSITTGTDPNRIVFWSGSNFDPEERAQGRNCRDDKSEPNNLRCWVKGALPEPGYTYAGNALEWPTIPEVLEDAGIDWRIYQDPNDNWTGAMHGGLAFRGFRETRPGEPLYEKGMRHWSLEQLEADVKAGKLPAVSWILPPKHWSEHPAASSPIEGAEFTARVLAALTANPEVWASTVVFQTFDENDGQFDHVPPPAPPSYNRDGTLAGRSTFDLSGEYFDDHERKYTTDEDRVTGHIRPWGLGPRVPMYVISPWSKGGWVNSEVFDHTSVGRFLEARFGITIPAISPWHRRMCGDLTSCFDFSTEQDPALPILPATKGSRTTLAEHLKRPEVVPPSAPQGLFQERGLRRSRALPYVLHVDARMQGETVLLDLRNEGTVGATFHVYDRRHLERIPRRYAVEAGKTLSDRWSVDPQTGLDLTVLGPNGFMRALTLAPGAILPTLTCGYDTAGKAVIVTLAAGSTAGRRLTIGRDAYNLIAARHHDLARGGELALSWPTQQCLGWYDFTVESHGQVMRFAGRLEDGTHGISDPLMFIA